MGAHLYWRLRFSFSHDPSSPWVTVAEVAMRAAPGGENLCTGGMVIAGGDWQGGYPAAYAFDGKPDSAAEARLPAWIGYKFPQPVDVVEVQLTSWVNWPAETPRNFAVEWSDDGDRWQSAAAFDFPGFAIGSSQTFSIGPALPRPPLPGMHWAGAALPGKPMPKAVHNAVQQQCSSYPGKCPGRHGEMPSSRARDFWGLGRIEGRVTIEGQPASRRVRLFEERTGLLLGETWSRPDGHYQFDYLDTTRNYFVLAHDHVQQFNAVIADWVQPEPFAYA